MEEPAKKPPKKLPGKSKTPRKDAPGKDRGIDEKRVDHALGPRHERSGGG
jgi:hypothetical protein